MPRPNKLAEALDALQRGGVDARLQERHETLLIWSVSEGYPEIALALIDAGADLDATNSDGNTALLRSACEGRLPLTRALIDAGADLDVQNADGYTAVILAKRRGNDAIAGALVEAGADLGLRTEAGLGVDDPGDSPKVQLVGARDEGLEERIVEAIGAPGGA